MKQIIVIPARMKGTRLPGKPLIEIMGKAIIHHVWDRCRHEVEPENIYIATEDDEIDQYCKNNNIQCVVTQASETAIDRIKYFSDLIPADAYINIQGDEPVVNVHDIETLLAYNRKYPDRVVFGKTKANVEEFNDHSKAKVVCDRESRLLYSSRAGIPINNQGEFAIAIGEAAGYLSQPSNAICIGNQADEQTQKQVCTSHMGDFSCHPLGMVGAGRATGSPPPLPVLVGEYGVPGASLLGGRLRSGVYGSNPAHGIALQE